MHDLLLLSDKLQQILWLGTIIYYLISVGLSIDGLRVFQVQYQDVGLVDPFRGSKEELLQSPSM